MICVFTQLGEKAVSQLNNTGNIKNRNINDYLSVQQTENFAVPLSYYKLQDDLKKDDHSLWKLSKEYLTQFEIRQKLLKVLKFLRLEQFIKVYIRKKRDVERNFSRLNNS
jgi:hypothetical protein